MAVKGRRQKRPDFFKMTKANMKELGDYQKTTGDIDEAFRHLTPSDIHNFRHGRFKPNPMITTPDEYGPTHTLLKYVSKGRLRGKKIVQLGASNGVYMRFLQDKLGATAIALDNNFRFLREATQRGVKRAIVASGVPVEYIGWKERKSGLLTPVKKVAGLPFADKSLDFIVSDHFLFADYHSEFAHTPGFEERPGSIKKSEEALQEYNRVLKIGGRIIVSWTHAHELPQMSKYLKGFRKNGFIVEHSLSEEVMPTKKGTTPIFFVLKKIRQIK